MKNQNHINFKQNKPAFTLGGKDGLQLKKAAFTLAEVLIVLGIIGVVAAMTLPNLIEKYQKLETVTALKKQYTVLQQVVKRSELDNGSVNDWDYSADALTFYKTYLKPYMQVSKEYINVSKPENLTYYMLNGEYNPGWSYYYPSSPKIILND